MSELLTYNGKKAAQCVVGRHAPRPGRYIWHHVLPKVCGGKTTPDNLIELCDNCHYTIHAMMWQLANGSWSFKRYNKKQFDLANKGYFEAMALGVGNLIPNEGFE